MMKRQLWMSALLCALATEGMAQKIDFNLAGKNESQVNETGYTAWAVDKATVNKKTLDGGLSLELNIGGAANQTMKSNWWKDAITSKNSKLIGDCVAVYGLDADDNTPVLTDVPTTLNLVVKGLAAGQHSLLAYHNVTDGAQTNPAKIEVKVNGETVLTDVEQSSRELAPSAAGQSYITFTATEGEPVTISYTTILKEGETYTTTGVFINALIFDQPNPKATALDPYPTNRDMHVDGDNGSIELAWTMPFGAVKNHLYVGTSENDMKEVAVTTESSYTLTDVYSMNTYYWRVDEEDAAGNIYKGETWSFRPRQLAFPGAEGYGRFATGGRGGTVYHVTSLDDDATNPQPGTLRYGLTKVSGPRTIVFDVAGVITLKARLVSSDPYVTIAGQTAPGTGIMLRGDAFGMGNEGITRFIRLRLGGGDSWDGVSPNTNTSDGMGMAGNDHSIMDHCSVGWTIDEAFSSRGAKNVTLQRTLISEALNVAGHKNYEAGKGHGYAATIGGDYGSYHHNLLAHNEGRNWSMSGGLDGGGSYSGHHDMFNNVCYNWRSRTTDGGTHQGQFVNNYYKMGPATTNTYLLTADLEGTGKGSQSYYVSGNIRESINGTLTQDKENVTYRTKVSGGQVVNWDVFVDEPFFESHATIEPAKLAYKTVLSDVGCNQPFFDNHDTRMVEETLKGTYTYKGSRTKYPGLIDKESDSEGFEGLNIVASARPANFDTDQDGMPDWWEKAKGLDPNTADNNKDEDRDGYTALEDYLNWMACPHYIIKSQAAYTIDLKTLFAGFDNDPSFKVTSSQPEMNVSVDENGLMTIKPDNVCFCTISVEATDKDDAGSMTRSIGIYATDDESLGISLPTLLEEDGNTAYQLYTLGGILIHKGKETDHLPAGAYILKVTNGKHVHTQKVLKR
ncbi:MAG: T9SS type A sorting domain-containing protein [Bacteroidaceae bacterium]|nr:T9SS type A sorting domain-containing protein [Bacteroidaceae bacterium]